MSDIGRGNDTEIDADGKTHHNARERKRSDRIKDSFAMCRDSSLRKKTLKTDKRAHLNLLERQRRKRIKDSYGRLCDKLPHSRNAGRLTRQQILEKAVEFMPTLRRNVAAYKDEIKALQREKKKLEEQLRVLLNFETEGRYAEESALIEELKIAEIDHDGRFVSSE